MTMIDDDENDSDDDVLNDCYECSRMIDVHLLGLGFIWTA